MNSRVPRSTQPITCDQFVELIEDGQKADLLDGNIYVASPDSPEAARINVFLSGLLDFYVTELEIGKVYGPRSAFRLAETYAPEPDIAFVRKDRLGLWRGSIFRGAPDVAVEIVTEDSVDRDTNVKRSVYERGGADEYWLIHILESRCTFLRIEDGAFRDVTPRSGSIFRSETIPGFWLDIEWLFAEELPKPLGCLKKILAWRR